MESKVSSDHVYLWHKYSLIILPLMCSFKVSYRLLFSMRSLITHASFVPGNNIGWLLIVSSCGTVVLACVARLSANSLWSHYLIFGASSLSIWLLTLTTFLFVIHGSWDRIRMISSATSNSDLRASLIPSINFQFSSMSILALLSVINVMVTSPLGVPHLFWRSASQYSTASWANSSCLVLEAESLGWYSVANRMQIVLHHLVSTKHNHSSQFYFLVPHQ